MKRADFCIQSIQQLPKDELLRLGIRVLLIDVDNTLMRHGQRRFDAPTLAFLESLKVAGFRLFLCSNAKADRLESLAHSADLEAIPKAQKPSGKAIRRFLEEKHIDPKTVAMVGDQYFTDVWAAEHAGLCSIWSKPLSEDEAWFIRPKRCLEALLIRLWNLEFRDGDGA